MLEIASRATLWYNVEVIMCCLRATCNSRRHDDKKVSLTVMDTIPQNTPQKQCHVCHEWFPATSEYFTPSKKSRYGVDTKCKECRKKSRRKVPQIESLPEGYKRCSTCKQPLPATTEFFYERKSSKDGLNTQCKECIKTRVTNRYHDPESHEKIMEYRRNPETQAKAKETQRKYMARPEIHARYNAWKRENYHRPEVREKVLEYSRRPDVRAKHRESERRRNARPEIRAKKYAQQREYRNRPDVRARRSVYAAIYQRIYVNTTHGRAMKRAHDREHYQRVKSHPELYARHLAEHRISSHRRKAREKAVQGTYNSEQIQEQLKRQKYRCYYAACGHAKFKKEKGKYVYHIEHTYPLSRVAGTDIPANGIDYIVLACPECNSIKHNRFPWEWPEGGRLL